MTHVFRISTVPAGLNGGRWGFGGVPGSVCPERSGSTPDRVGDDLDAIAGWGAVAVLALADDGELVGPGELGRETRSRFMEWHQVPFGNRRRASGLLGIVRRRPTKGSTPPSDITSWALTSAKLRKLVDRGWAVYVHDHGDGTRAATVVARLLVEGGETPAVAVERVREASVDLPRPVHTPDDWIASASTDDLIEPSTSDDARRERALGAMLGLAVGDAVGTTLEFEQKPPGCSWTGWTVVARSGWHPGSGRTTRPWRWRWPTAWSSIPTSMRVT